jgi:hypothetical protein
MVRMGKRGLKALKLFHVMLCAIWFGSALSMLVLSLAVELGGIGMLVQDYETALFVIHTYVVVNSARAVLITGVVYGVFTKWGFFKSTWLVVKWILTFGLVAFCHAIPHAIPFSILTGSILLGGLLILFILSIYKPAVKKSRQESVRATQRALET